MEQTEFCLKALHEGVRVSGRGFSERRPLVLEFGPNLGQALVTLGHTFVIGNVNSEVVMPSLERPSEGLLSISAHYSQAAKLDGANPRHHAHHIAHIIERILRGSRVIDPESLCILSGKQVWSLRVDLHIVYDGGNALDACGIACMAALMHFRRRNVTIRGKDVFIHSTDEQVPTPLPLLHHPIPVSFAVFEIQSAPTLLVDPDNVEEVASTTVLTVAANPAGEICLVHKDGGAAMPTILITQCLKVAEGHARNIASIITKALNSQQESRSQLIAADADFAATSS